MSDIYFGDNLPILQELPSESIDLIYIDPPFNTGKTQELKRIKTKKSINGDRVGFQGNSYETIELGKKAYRDKFENKSNAIISPEIKKAYEILAPHSSTSFLEEFLKPRLLEAYRLLKSNGSLYFHIDYREVHYCKVLLDNIFGRENFLNEIIWAYDFGGKARSRWPAKHDNILLYVKNKSDYIFNTNDIDREDYMAPGLVGLEKAEKGKQPTDTWFWKYVGRKGMRNSDSWWMTIVGTNSYERTGYPTQKPVQLTNRILLASSFPGSTVLDFFAGSGTVGESCRLLKRNFILIDNNEQAIEVMSNRFRGIKDINWIGFTPDENLKKENNSVNQSIENNSNNSAIISEEFKHLVSITSHIQKELEDTTDLWKNSPLEWMVYLPARSKSRIARKIITEWFKHEELIVEREPISSETLWINGKKYATKFSTLWTNGIYQFQQIRLDGPDLILCFGISPLDAHCWILNKEMVSKYGRVQHKGAREYLLSINPNQVPDWAMTCGGTLSQALKILKK